MDRLFLRSNVSSTLMPARLIGGGESGAVFTVNAPFMISAERLGRRKRGDGAGEV